jgi:integrase
MPTFRPGAGPGDLVFTSSKGMPRRRSFAARVFKPGAAGRARPGADVPGLRKVATGYMVDDKIHTRVIQHRLGHATARLSQELYAKVSDAADHDAATLLGARFSSATGTQRARTPESD